ncbi:MAG: glycoside hydrolase family 3 C-terminal domain-containing protein [bacterium]|nr:glycoside hydrolase family 3 C-terminal domain-containing protein [bacterium]
MSEVERYRDAQESVAVRVEDLLGRMTWEEKAGQVLQIDGRHDWKEQYLKYEPGSMLNVLDEAAAEVQELARKSRLGIPVLLGIDAIHGHSLKRGATIFPTQLALSCSWNPGLAEEVARVTAVEVSYTGAHWTFAPVFCLARDLRWGRVDETSGEDPRLVGDFGCAMVRGFQGERMNERRRVIACAKHFAGYGETQGGRDASEGEHTERKMRAWFLPAFERGVRAGCATVMTAYHVIDGTPCTGNRWLLTEVLRGEWGFEGVVVTDYDNVGRMHREQRVSESVEEAVVVALEAGNDLLMHTPGCYEAILRNLRSGRLREEVLDRAVRRILRLKFAMGLFEDARLPDEEGARLVLNCAEHRAVALEAARQSIVLLKNDGILPLREGGIRRVLVCGPLADNAFGQLGDWSLGSNPADEGTHPREATVTVLDGLRERIGGVCEVAYERGCTIYEGEGADERVQWEPGRFSTEEAGIKAAVQAARGADVVIAVVGDTVSLTGEMRSTATLELMGPQRELLRALRGTGRPLVVVLINSKPLVLTWVSEYANAVVEAFNPGMLGGKAIAEILMGDTVPTGKLTISFPAHVGQQPVWYHQLPGTHGTGYADGISFEALYPFGFGLSYTRYEYRNLRLARGEVREGEALEVEVEVENVGERDGEEIVQVYVRDLFTSVTWPQKLLKAYARVRLRAGERRVVRFTIPYWDLALVDRRNRWVVEPGEFEVMVGGSSRENDLLKAGFRVVHG